MTDALTSEQQQAVAASFPGDDRWERVRRVLADRQLDVILAVGANYATWLVGYHRYFGGLSATLIGPTGGVELLASADEAPVAEAESTAARVHVYGEAGFGLDLDPQASLLAALPGLDLVRRARRLGVAGLSPAQLGGITAGELVGVDDELATVMARKDRDEAEKVAKAYNLCLLAQEAVGRGVQEGATELELFTRAHGTAQVAHGAPVEFISDLLSGPNSAAVCCPIAVAGRRGAEEGEPVVADIAVRADGYWGDTCRTHVRGRSGELDVLLERLAAVLDGCVAALRPGVPANHAHADMVRRLQDAFPDSLPLPHHGGHGLGLGPCDSPHIIPRDDTVLEAGMVLAVEPGAYFPGRFGIRLENEYLVTSAGAIELNAALASLSAGASR